MKNLFKTLFIISVVFLVSCTKNENTIYPEKNDEGIITLSREIDTPQSKSEENLIITAIYDTDNETLVDCIVPEIVLSSANISKEEFIARVNQEFYAQEDNATKSEFSFGGCLDDCNKKFTDANGKKIEGRGACKAGCWISLAVEIAEKICKMFD